MFCLGIGFAVTKASSHTHAPRFKRARFQKRIRRRGAVRRPFGDELLLRKSVPFTFSRGSPSPVRRRARKWPHEFAPCIGPGNGRAIITCLSFLRSSSPPAAGAAFAGVAHFRVPFSFIACRGRRDLYGARALAATAAALLACSHACPLSAARIYSRRSFRHAPHAASRLHEPARPLFFRIAFLLPLFPLGLLRLVLFFPPSSGHAVCLVRAMSFVYFV